MHGRPPTPVESVAPAAAPVLGGWILAVADWQAIFWLLLAYGIACLVVAWKQLPETMPVAMRRPISPTSVVATYLSLLARPSFLLPVLVGGLGMASLFCYITGSPFVLIDLHGLSEQQYGYVFGANALGVMVAAQANRMLLKRRAVPTVLAIGLGINLVAGLGVTLAVAFDWPLVALLVPLWFAVASIAMIGSNAAALAMGASAGRAGSASALVGTMQFTMATLFSAVVAATQNGTAWPMATLMVIAGAAANLLWWVTRRRIAVARPPAGPLS